MYVSIRVRTVRVFLTTALPAKIGFCSIPPASVTVPLATSKITLDSNVLSVVLGVSSAWVLPLIAHLA